MQASAYTMSSGCIGLRELDEMSMPRVLTLRPNHGAHGCVTNPTFPKSYKTHGAGLGQKSRQKCAMSPLDL